MTQVTAGFEGGTNGNNVLAADPGDATAWDSVTGAGPTTNLKYDNTHVLNGTLSCLVAGSASDRYAEWSTALGTVTDHYGRIYLYMTANPGNVSPIIWVGSGATQVARMLVNSSGSVRFDSADTNNVLVTTAAVSLNQWIRIEWHIVHSATVGQLELKLFNTASASVPTETDTSPANLNTGASANDIRFGIPEAGFSFSALWMDAIVAGATSYPGPIVEPVTTPQVLSMQSHVFGHGVW